MPINAKPHCPFGKMFKPQNNEAMVLYGKPGPEGWRQVRGGHLLGLAHILYLPLGESPGKYYWPVAGLGVVTTNGGDCDEHESNQLAQALLDAGATYVVDCSPHIEAQPRFYYPAEQKSHG